jgi:hypothetical protein
VVLFYLYRKMLKLLTIHFVNAHDNISPQSLLLAINRSAPIRVIVIDGKRKQRNKNRANNSRKRIRINQNYLVLNVTRLDNSPDVIKEMYFTEEKVDGEWIYWPLIPLNSLIFWSIVRRDSMKYSHHGTSLSEVFESIDRLKEMNCEFEDCPF